MHLPLGGIGETSGSKTISRVRARWNILDWSLDVKKVGSARVENRWERCGGGGRKRERHDVAGGNYSLSSQRGGERCAASRHD